MAYKFEITCLVSDSVFDNIDYKIYATIEKEIREHIGVNQGLLPTKLYQKAIQHALWTLEREGK